MLFENSYVNYFMKFVKLFSLSLLLVSLFSCDTIQKATNSTGGVFSLTGTWELTSNTPENKLTGSKVTVAPFLAEGTFTTLLNNSQCYRANDIKWKNIASDNSGGFTLNNLLSNCNTATLNYQPATIAVINNNEIRLSGKNVDGAENTQTWRRNSK